jgi:pimeloyl-ACP methyl ester carboxylesterase
MTTFVLVHGAWHGAWCWYRIVDALEQEGHRAIAIDLPGHGIDQSVIGDVSLEDMVERVGSRIEAIGEPVVLVGHSFGGTVITATAEKFAPRLKTLVYLTAIVPKNGQSTIDAARPDTDSLLPGTLTTSEDGKAILGTTGDIREIFYAKCPSEDLSLARMLLVSESVRALEAEVRTTPQMWGSIPKVYVECTLDRAIGIAQQRRFWSAAEVADVRTLETDHSPFFSAPEALTSILCGF